MNENNKENEKKNEDEMNQPIVPLSVTEEENNIQETGDNTSKFEYLAKKFIDKTKNIEAKEIAELMINQGKTHLNTIKSNVESGWESAFRVSVKDGKIDELLKVIDLLLGRCYYSDNIWNDYKYHVKNRHVLFALFYAESFHPFTKKDRLKIEFFLFAWCFMVSGIIVLKERTDVAVWLITFFFASIPCSMFSILGLKLATWEIKARIKFGRLPRFCCLYCRKAIFNLYFVLALFLIFITTVVLAEKEVKDPSCDFDDSPSCKDGDPISPGQVLMQVMIGRLLGYVLWFLFDGPKFIMKWNKQKELYQIEQKEQNVQNPLNNENNNIDKKKKKKKSQGKGISLLEHMTDAMV